MAKKVSLDKLEEKDVDSLLQTFREDLNKLEKQRHQLEEEVEAEQQQTVSSMSQTMEYQEEIDPDVELAGLASARC